MYVELREQGVTDSGLRAAGALIGGGLALAGGAAGAAIGDYLPCSTPHRPRPRDLAEPIETVGLSDRATARIASLSGGERRRLDVAIGIIGRPEVLFLDEPTAGLDPLARRGFHDLVWSVTSPARSCGSR